MEAVQNSITTNGKGIGATISEVETLSKLERVASSKVEHDLELALDALRRFGGPEDMEAAAKAVRRIAGKAMARK
jgi:hypothetical protein